jgi:hypothetical protein
LKLTDSKFWKEAKPIKSRDLLRVWLVWTVGTYANGLPWIELRAIYANETSAREFARELGKYECRKAAGMGGMYREKVVLEPRVMNHLYADEMKSMCLKMSNSTGAFAE